MKKANASHLTAIDLYYTHIQGDSFKFVLKLYRDCEGVDLGTAAFIELSSVNCGFDQEIQLNIDSSREVSQLCPSQIINSSCNSGNLPGVQEFTYSLIYELPQGCSDWILSYQDCARNAMITNIDNPGNSCMYVEAMLNNLDSTLINNSPVFTTIPLVYACSGLSFNFNHGGLDQDGDSLVFSLVTPLTGVGGTVSFNAPNTATYPIIDNRGFNTFDSTTGEMTFEPSSPQVAVTAIKVEEYRDGVLIGFVTRDLQMIIRACSNSQPSTTTGIQNNDAGTITGPNSIDLCNKNSVNFEIGYQDPDGSDQVSIQSNVNLVISGATYTSVSGNPARIFIHLDSSNFSGSKSFTVTVSDDGCDVYTTQVYTYTINFVSSTRVNEDQEIFCPGGISAQLDALGGSVFTWRAIEGDSIIVGTNFSCNPCANPIPTPDTLTVYEVTSDTDPACSNKDTVTVKVVPGFSTSIDSIGTEICFEDTVLLNIVPSDTGTYKYNWYPASLIANDTLASTSAILTESQNIVSHVLNVNTGCVVPNNIDFYVAQHINFIDLEDSMHLCRGDSITLEAKTYFLDSALCNVYQVEEIPFDPFVGQAGWIGSTTSNCVDCIDSNVPIGFDFTFYCESYNEINISSNGWVSFDPQTNAEPIPQFLPNASAPNNLIALFWANLQIGFTVGPNIRYRLEGTPGDQTFIIRYDRSSGGFFGTIFSGEIHLKEIDNSIELHIEQVIDFNGTTTRTLGVENKTGQYATSPIGFNQSNWSRSLSAYRFYEDLLSPVSNAHYTWSPSDYLADSSLNPTGTKPLENVQYNLAITDSSDRCFHLYDSIFIEVTPNAIPQITLSDDTICLGESVTLNGTGGISYSWNFENSNSTGSSLTHDPTKSLNFTLIADSGYGCVDSTQTMVTVVPFPSQLSISQDLDICAGDSVILSALAYEDVLCNDYQINSIPYTETPPPASLPLTAWNNSTVSNCNDCVQTSVPIGFDFGFFCNTYNTVNISSEGFISFDGLTAGAFPTQFIPDAASPNNLIALCWTDLNPILFGLIEYRTIGTPGNRIFMVRFDNIVSDNQFFSINGSIWLIESTNNIEIHVENVSPSFFPTAKTLGIENEDGSIGYTPLNRNSVHWNTNFEAWEFASSSLIVDPVVYNWSPGIELIDSLAATTSGHPSSSTNFIVSVSDSMNQCPPLVDSIAVTFHEYPIVQASVSEDTVCPGDNITLTALGATNYSWNSGQNTASFSLAQNSNQTYIVQADNGFGCFDSDTVQVWTYTVINPSISVAPSSSICLGDTTVLTGSGSSSYSWSTGDTTSSIQVSPGSSFNYILTGLDSNGCFGQASTTISVFSTAVDSISGPDSICTGSFATLNMTGDNFYLWHSGDTNSIVDIHSDSNQTYTVVVTNAFGCSFTDSQYVVILPLPTPLITGDSAIHFGEQTTLTSTLEQNYLWNTGEVTQNITVSPDSNNWYYIETTSLNGCTALDSILVIVDPTRTIPNIITPNGDGQNEFFILTGFRTGGILKIFNRWGVLVYQNESYQNDFTGQDLLDGVYYYEFWPVHEEGDLQKGYKGWLEIRE